MTIPVITKDKDTLYKVDFDENSSVEIGDGISSTLTPQVTIKKWGDECWLKLKPATLYTKNLPSEIGIESIEKLEVVSDDGKEAHHIYVKENEADQDEGVIELEAVLFSKPSSIPFTHQWDFEDSGNLAYLYQDNANIPIPEKGKPYTVDADNEQGFVTVYPPDPIVASRDDSGDYDKDGKQIKFVPDWAIRSYAVYRKNTPFLMSEEDGAKYKTGKVGHLKRPKLIDAIGAWEWGEIRIDEENKTITVTGSQEFTDKAVLPVRIDPTFGYSTAGSSYGYFYDSIIGSNTTPSSRGVVTSLHAYISGWDSGEDIKMALVDFSRKALKEPVTEEKDGGHSGADWIQFNFTEAKPAVDNSRELCCAVWNGTNCLHYSDAGSTNDSYYWNYITYASNWPRDLSSLYGYNYIYSTYATYTASTIDHWENCDEARAYHYPGKTSLDIDGSGFGASQGDGWVKLGDADTYSGSSTFDTLTINSWSDTQINVSIPESLSNTLGWLYLYVKPNGGSANTAGFSANVDNAWGQRYPETYDSGLNACRAMSGTSPNISGMTLQAVKIYVGQTHSAQLRISVYQGGSLSTGPVGATLLEDLGVTSGSGVEQWITVTSSTNPSLAANTVTWIGMKGNDSGFYIVYDGTSYPGGDDWQSANGRWNSVAISSDDTVAWPSTWPTDGSGSFADFWYSVYLEYDVAAGFKHKIHGISGSNIGKVHGISVANIGKIHGVSSELKYEQTKSGLYVPKEYVEPVTINTVRKAA